MEKGKVYAVVDIETTGSDLTVDRIIQFGCVLIENGKIVSRFATNLNPDRAIPQAITSLTGIETKEVVKAPYMEDVAYTIYQLLSDCVFVAHNIYFDYPFINQELTRCGLPELNLELIDTVELAQIIFPTFQSYRLQDLAQELDLIHENPHQADSDAEVTAELFLKITEKIKQLPLVTLEKICALADVLGGDTGKYLQKELMKAKDSPVALDPHLHIVADLALQRPENRLYQENTYTKKHFPKTKKAKEQILLPHFAYRSVQGKMMNEVYRFFTEKPEKALAIEAPPGIGKTFGYLFPLSYLATQKEPVIISTYSIVLEEQLYYEAIPHLNQCLPLPLQAVLLKSPRHFIDLDRFAASLVDPPEQKHYRLYQMKILVWLTETQTGDLSELRMLDKQHYFWEVIQHRGPKTLDERSPYYQVDFYRQLMAKMQQANVIIVNHAFLCQERERVASLLPNSKHLVIDEAHHFLQVLEQSVQEKLVTIEWKRELTILLKIAEKFLNLLEGEESYQTCKLFSIVLTELKEQLSQFLHIFSKVWKNTNKKEAANEELLLEEEWLSQQDILFQKELQNLLSLVADGTKASEQLQSALALTKDKWSVSERRTVEEWLERLATFNNRCLFFIRYFKNWHQTEVKWFQFAKKSDEMTFYAQNVEAYHLEEEEWYQRFEKVLFTGATLQLGKKKPYFSAELGLDTVKIKSLPNPYHYEKQARLYVAEQGKSVLDDQEEYSAYIADFIRKMAEQFHEPFFVLFTSKDLLQQVYYQIQNDFFEQGRELLAQDISGTAEKILKKFQQAEEAILLGTNAFWDGIDLPGDQLPLIILTRLPFDVPTRPFTKAKYAYLEENGKSAFYEDALPKAALRLRQALGRLIRSEKDRGVLIILDERFSQATYARSLQKALPSDLPIITTDGEQILVETLAFLKE